jgi:hypothetical protein
LTSCIIKIATSKVKEIRNTTEQFPSMIAVKVWMTQRALSVSPWQAALVRVGPWRNVPVRRTVASVGTYLCARSVLAASPTRGSQASIQPHWTPESHHAAVSVIKQWYQV